MSDLELLIADAEIGESAREFLASDIGRYILGRAEAEINAAVEELKRITPTDTGKITELQNNIWRAESVLLWISQAIEAGNEALNNFTQTEE